MGNEIKNAVEEVIAGNASLALVGKPNADPPRVIFPGSFNPLHSGHRKIASIAENMIGGPLFYEISIDNVDKPSLGVEAVTRRASQFSKDETIAVTRAVTFEKKVLLFPGAVFAVGVDTLARIGNPKYYSQGGDDDAEQRMRVAIDTLEKNRCRILVFGRKMDHEFFSLEDLRIPPKLFQLCRGVPECNFREDISSSELR